MGCANQHGLLDRREFDLVLQRLATEDAEMPVIRAPYAYATNGLRQGRVVAAHFPWGDVQTRR
eukprot:1853331-Heterocapsa_arctica.AAC.1